MVYFKSS